MGSPVPGQPVEATVAPTALGSSTSMRRPRASTRLRRHLFVGSVTRVGGQDGIVRISLVNFAAEGVIRVGGSAGCGGDISAGAVGIGNRMDIAESVVGGVGVDRALRIGIELSLRQTAKAIHDCGCGSVQC